jgi:putative sterol carrier protein
VSPAWSGCDGTSDADTTIAVSKNNPIKLLDGKLDAMLASGLGRITLRGSKDAAMKLVAALS